jgi:hypothetical protein
MSKRGHESQQAPGIGRKPSAFCGTVWARATTAVYPPCSITQGAITAMKSNAGRREITALQLAPGTLVS